VSCEAHRSGVVGRGWIGRSHGAVIQMVGESVCESRAVGGDGGCGGGARLMLC
jgi:hypothetical protein